MFVFSRGSCLSHRKTFDYRKPSEKPSLSSLISLFSSLGSPLDRSSSTSCTDAVSVDETTIGLISSLIHTTSVRLQGESIREKLSSFSHTLIVLIEINMQNICTAEPAEFITLSLTLHISSSSLSFAGMKTSFGANAELLQCVPISSVEKPNFSKSLICKTIYSSSSKRMLSMATEGKRTRKEAQKCCVISNSKKEGAAESMTYKAAGVDIDAGSELVRRIAKMAPGIGGFGGLFPLGDSYLVAGTDGVGTKLKLAFETGIHDTIGIDLVAMSVNDIVTSGAKPLFFLDYYATSHLDVDLAEKVIKGIVDGCQQSDCALLGGETAEMPDFYANGEYDLSGFAVGVVKKDSVIDGKNIVAGDVLIGLPSSGVHSNGFSLVRRVLDRSGLSLKDQLPGEPTTLGEALMAPTVIYVKQVLDIISKGGVKGIAHITGGGFTDNIPRVFPKGLGAAIQNGSWDIPPVFKWIQEAGRIEDSEMMRTFNMGIGMVLVVSPKAAIRILGDKEGNGSNVLYRIGEVINGEGVTYR